MQGLKTEVTTLDKCEPGDLVRELTFPSLEGFSIVTRDAQDQTGAIWVLHLEQWMRAERVEDSEAVVVLRFLDPLLINVDHLDLFEIKANRLFQETGALVFSKHGQFLNARIGMQGASRGLLQVDLNTGLCRRYAEQLTGAYFGRWSVSVVPDKSTRLAPVMIYGHEVKLD